MNLNWDNEIQIVCKNVTNNCNSRYEFNRSDLHKCTDNTTVKIENPHGRYILIFLIFAAYDVPFGFVGQCLIYATQYFLILKYEFLTLQNSWFLNRTMLLHQYQLNLF